MLFSLKLSSLKGELKKIIIIKRDDNWKLEAPNERGWRRGNPDGMSLWGD